MHLGTAAWDDYVLCGPDGPAPWDAFYEEYGQLLRDHAVPQRLDALTGADLQECARTMAAAKAGGLDGWTVADLHQLPTPLWDRLADLLTGVEEAGTWPDAVTKVYVALCTKREGSADPLEQRPISVASLIYRVWSKVRMRQSNAWVLQWIPAALIGGVPGRGTTEEHFALSL